jgi:hypothetical protein
MADRQATFGIKIEADSVSAKSAAGDLEGLRAGIEKSNELIKQLSATNRQLRGSSQEVKDARQQLKAAIDAERASVSKATLELGKHGKLYGQLADQQKKAKESTDSIKKAISTAGGPVRDLSDRFASLKELFGGVSSGMALAGVAAVAFAAVLVAFTAAVVASVVALGKFVVESANALRAMSLTREAATGSAADAARFGNQIDLLATKLATPKEKLNELAVSIRKSVDGTRIGGQGIVDTFTAVASASEAMGDDVGRSIEGLITRGKQFGRMRLAPLELQGTGLKFDDIAGALAKNMKIGVDQARQALYSGLVPIDAGAKAVKDAVEKRFGEVNAKKLLDINVIAQKFHENLVGLTKGVNLEPFLKAIKSIADVFSETSSTGQTLKVFITAFGNTLGAVFQGIAPFAVQLIKEMINTALKLGIALVTVASAVVDFASPFLKLIGVREIMTGLKIAFVALGAAAVVFAAMTIPIWGPIVAGVGLAAVIFGELVAIVEGLADIDWGFLGGQIVKGLTGIWNSAKSFVASFVDLGAQIVNGIVTGIENTWTSLTGKVSDLANGIKKSFASALGIHSPSTVFRAYGEQTTAGYAEGVQGTAPVAARALDDMVAPTGQVGVKAVDDRVTPTGQVTAKTTASPSPQVLGASSGAGMRPQVTVNLNISGTNAKETADALKSASVVDTFTDAIEKVMRGASVPTQTAVAA